MADPRAGSIVKLAPDGTPATDINGNTVRIATVTPPPGLEVGYVPIATRQELETKP